MLFKIKDFEGKEVNISPSVGLYRVKDYMGKQLYGLAILLDRVDAQGQNAEPYGVLTKSFGEFIGQKNCAYIDTNNNPFAEQLLEAGIAEQTPFDKQSGFCRYPLWHFKESFLQEVGGAAYLVYCDTFNAYMPKPRNTQEEAAKMDAFREQAAPFYIVDHDDGTFSLCFPFSLCGHAMVDNCQKAFDAYAQSIGLPAIDSRGFHTFGNGYEWEEIFRQAFQNDPKLQEIRFDSEAGGFFCYADSLEVLTDLGSRFCEICKNPEQFAALIPTAVAVAENRFVWKKADLSGYTTVRDFLQKNPANGITIHTTEGYTELGPKDIRRMLVDESSLVSVGDGEFPARWLLEQELGRGEQNVANPNLLKIETAGYSARFTPVMSM